MTRYTVLMSSLPTKHALNCKSYFLKNPYSDARITPQLPLRYRSVVVKYPRHRSRSTKRIFLKARLR